MNKQSMSLKLQNTSQYIFSFLWKHTQSKDNAIFIAKIFVHSFMFVNSRCRKLGSCQFWLMTSEYFLSKVNFNVFFGYLTANSHALLHYIRATLCWMCPNISVISIDFGLARHQDWGMSLAANKVSMGTFTVLNKWGGQLFHTTARTFDHHFFFCSPNITTQALLVYLISIKDFLKSFEPCKHSDHYWLVGIVLALTQYHIMFQLCCACSNILYREAQVPLTISLGSAFLYMCVYGTVMLF